MGLERTNGILIMVVYECSVANIILTDEIVNTFTLKSRTRLKCQHPPFLFNMVPEVLACGIRQVKKIKDKKIREKEAKLCL